MLRQLRRHIVANLEMHRDNAPVLKKYEWLAGYHDRFCRTSLGSHAREHLIGPVDGPQLQAFGAEVPCPEPPADAFSGLDF